MFLSSWRRFEERKLPASRQAGRRPRSPRLHCEQLEPRLQPSAFTFSTGNPDGRVATISEPPNAHNSQVEFESADDFVLTTETTIRHASFTGLLTGGATLRDVSNVFITIYRVFPNDSDVGRTSGPPTFSTPQVPTRVNSPADNEIENRDSAAGELNFRADVLSENFTAQASVSSADKIGVHSGGNGPATGEEVEFDITFRNHPLDLPAGHYFFVPKVGLTDQVPANADFLWLSAPRPIMPPGTSFTPDLQSWMRDDPGLAPDWLRIGTDIIGGTTFNASFTLSGEARGRETDARGSPDLAPPGTGALQASILAAPLPDGASTTSTVAGVQRGLSNAQPLLSTDNVPAVTATLTQSGKLQDVTLPWKSAPPHGQSVIETAPDDEGIASDPLVSSTGV